MTKGKMAKVPEATLVDPNVDPATLSVTDVDLSGFFAEFDAAFRTEYERELGVKVTDQSYKKFSEAEQLERYAKNIVFWQKRYPTRIRTLRDKAQYIMVSRAHENMIKRAELMELPLDDLEERVNGLLGGNGPIRSAETATSSSAANEKQDMPKPSPASQPLTNGTAAKKSSRECAACGKTKAELNGGVLKVCSLCRQVRYCGRPCQHKDWDRHRELCIPTSEDSSHDDDDSSSSS